MHLSARKSRFFILLDGNLSFMDVLLLSRIQFAIHIIFHYLFPPLTIGLSVILVVMEALFLIKKSTLYHHMTRFWVKIFSLLFAMGVATGIINLFGLGTNWAGFSKYVGGIFGSMLGAEALFAFTLEAGFLGILLFGWNRVSHKIHFFSTLMVCLGAHLSGFWIVCVNSWMQTPAGFVMAGQGAEAHPVLTSFWEALFNPSSLVRLGHVYLGCWLSGAFLVCGISAYYLLKKREVDFARKSLTIALWFAAASELLQLVSGDCSARSVAKWQPAKLAAFEGVYETKPYTPAYLFGFPNSEEKRVKWGIKIPALLSLMVHHDLKKPVTGLDQYPEEDWPPVSPVFHCYHLMVSIWAMMLLLILWTIYQLWKKTQISTCCLRALLLSPLLPIIANLAGWISAEMGRQPWIVYGLLRTKEGLSASITSPQVFRSLLLIIFVESFITCMALYLLWKKIQTGPEVEGRKEDV